MQFMSYKYKRSKTLDPLKPVKNTNWKKPKTKSVTFYRATQQEIFTHNHLSLIDQVRAEIMRDQKCESLTEINTIVICV